MLRAALCALLLIGSHAILTEGRGCSGSKLAVPVGLETEPGVMNLMHGLINYASLQEQGGVIGFDQAEIVFRGKIVVNHI
jgi:hypothetical protein